MSDERREGFSELSGSRGSFSQEVAPESKASEAVKPAPAQISLVYESRDKKLCLFKDASGHLTAVRASRLA